LRIIRCNPLTLNVVELGTYSRTTQYIAQHINSDAVILQDLRDLAAACLEEAKGKCEAQDFEESILWEIHHGGS
jgi:hypothetical protein